MRNKIKASLAALALAMVIALSGSAPANADSFGNKVYLTSGSSGNVRVHGDVRFQGSNLQYYVKRANVWLAPGQNTWATGRMIDAKTFFAPWGCTTFRVTGTFTKKYTVMRAGYTHAVSQSFGVHTTLWVRC